MTIVVPSAKQHTLILYLLASYLADVDSDYVYRSHRLFVKGELPVSVLAHYELKAVSFFGVDEKQRGFG